MSKTFNAALIGATLALAACGGEKAPPPPTAADADAFVASVNDELRQKWALFNSASWLQSNFITSDSQMVATKFNEEFLAMNAKWVQQARTFKDVKDLKPETARALLLLQNVSAPPPSDPAKQAELAKLLSDREANYGAGKWCRKDAAGNDECLTIQAIEKIIANTDGNTAPEDIAAAWAGWHATSKPIRDEYRRMAELLNEGAKEMGFADAGEVWRGGYDMPPAAFADEIERLWSQVQPLYEALHCHVRARLNKKYGDEVVPKDGKIPAHLLGNMWAQ